MRSADYAQGRPTKKAIVKIAGKMEWKKQKMLEEVDEKY